MKSALLLRILIISLSLVLPATSFASNSIADKVRSVASGYLSNSNLANKELKGNVQMLKGRRDGLALIEYTTGAVYFGDIIDGKPDGQGVMILSESSVEPLLKGFDILAGRWKKGKPGGKMRCYDANGRLLFKGRLEIDGKLVEADMGDEDSDLMFSIIDGNDNYVYIGEINGIGMNGQGLLLFPDKSIFFSKFKDGERRGSGTYIDASHNWLTEAYKDGKTRYVSSSDEYSQIVTNTQQVASQWDFNWGEFLQGLSQRVQEFSEAIGSEGSWGSQAEDGYGYSSSSSFDSSSSSNRAGASSSPSGTKKIRDNMLSPSEQQNLNRDRNVYHNYDGQLAAIFAGNREAPCSHVRDIQSKMRGLRQKWESKGQQFPHLANEDKDCSGR